MLLSLDGTLVVQIVNFVVFLLILNAIFLKPVGKAIAERRAYINGIAADIEQFETDIKSLRAQAEEARAAARREADAALAQARSEAQKTASALLAERAEEAAAIAHQAQATVQLELAQARSHEKELVDQLARTMLERALGPEVAA